jgi:hypothetical protein
MNHLISRGGWSSVLALACILAGLAEGAVPVPGTVAISAVTPNEDAVSHEWIELQNRDCQPFDLNLCTLKFFDQSCNPTRRVQIVDLATGSCPVGADECISCAGTDCVVAANGGWFLVTSASSGDVSRADAAYSSGDFLQSDGAAVLDCAGVVMDTVGWNNTGTLPAGCAETPAVPVDLSAGESLVRQNRASCSIDTDANAGDFSVVFGPVVPGARSDGVGGGCACDLIFKDGFQ